MFEPPYSPVHQVTCRVATADLSRMQPHSRPDHALLEPVRGGSRSACRDARCKCHVIKTMRSSVPLAHEPSSSHGMSRTGKSSRVPVSPWHAVALDGCAALSRAVGADPNPRCGIKYQYR